MSDIGPTPSQTIGPFFSFGMQWLAESQVGAGDHPDGPVISGQVFDGDGLAVPDAVVEVWPFARSLTGPDGRYAVPAGKPTPPAAGQAPHLDVSIFARGLLQRLVTRIYFPDERTANAADPVLASVDADRRPTLVAHPDGRNLRFDIHLQGPLETVFFAF
jgi:protocatechuate 3,4-dioxygenase alpha subunit